MDDPPRETPEVLATSLPYRKGIIGAFASHLAGASSFQGTTMAKKAKAGKARKATVGERIHRFEEAVHDHVLAAEVAAEESAGYGSLTSAVEAAEAAAVPEHELGHAKPDHKDNAEAADG